MHLHEYLRDSGSTQSELAKQVGVTQGMVHQWLSGRRKISASRVLDISRATRGKVTPHELRPDIYPNPTDGLPAESIAEPVAGVE